MTNLYKKEEKDTPTGNPGTISHINQLIQNKKAVNRPKEIIDVMALEKNYKKIRDEKP